MLFGSLYAIVKVATAGLEVVTMDNWFNSENEGEMKSSSLRNKKF